MSVLLLTGLGLAAPAPGLIETLNLYFEGDLTQALSRAEQLQRAQPADGALRYWLARFQMEAGDFLSAESSLEGATATGQPLGRVQGLRALILAGQGRHEEALRQAREALLSLPDWDLERPELLSLAGVLLALSGQDQEAVQHLNAVGGHPLSALPESLHSSLPGALDVRSIELDLELSEDLLLVHEGREWRLDHQSGLMRVSTPAAGEPPPEWSQHPRRPRTEPQSCAEGWVWSSPSYLGSPGGIFRSHWGEVSRLTTNPEGVVDDTPVCSGDSLWWIRREAELSSICKLRDGVLQRWEQELPLGSLDVRSEHGSDQLLLTLLTEAGTLEIHLQQAREGELGELQRLSASSLDLSQARWSP